VTTLAQILLGTETPVVLREIADMLVQSFLQLKLREIAGAGSSGPLTHGRPIIDHTKRWLEAGEVEPAAR